MRHGLTTPLPDLPVGHIPFSGVFLPRPACWLSWYQCHHQSASSYLAVTPSPRPSLCSDHLVKELKLQGKGSKSGELCLMGGISGGYGDRRGIMPGDYVKLLHANLGIPAECLVRRR